MTPPSTGPETPTTPTNQYENTGSFPGLTRSITAPHSFPSLQQQSHRSHLAPEDAYVTSPPRRLGSVSSSTHHPSRSDTTPATTSRGGGRGGGLAATVGTYDSPEDRRGRSRSRRRKKKQYKKLLWVKQSYRDNYTDQATFLESLQRNPRLQPYQFWTLFSDSTVIVQQLCAVIIFTVCFSLIFQERLSCSSVAAGGSVATFLGWIVWTLWEWREQDAAEARKKKEEREKHHRSTSSVADVAPTSTRPGSATSVGSANLAVGPNIVPFTRLSQSASMTSLRGSGTSSCLAPRGRCVTSGPDSAVGSSSYQRHHNRHPSHEPPSSSRNHSRQPSCDPPVTDVATLRRRSPRQSRWENLVGTIKSSVLIVFFVSAVSPILKSLTRSFASDSIWAMSSFLLLINLFFFDYSIGIGGAVGPAAMAAAPVSTGIIAGMPRSGPAAFALNSATMASTVLASRLPQTSQVFSLTIFSMQMFALFPIFRRYARHHSLPVHVVLTSVLIVGAGAGAGVAFGSAEDYVENAVRGLLISVLSSVLAMGGCSYWLISLQKYKNAIIGPWDPARPIITGPGPGSLARMHFQQD